MELIPLGKSFAWSILSFNSLKTFQLRPEPAQELVENRYFIHKIPGGRGVGLLALN